MLRRNLKRQASRSLSAFAVSSPRAGAVAAADADQENLHPNLAAASPPMSPPPRTPRRRRRVAAVVEARPDQRCSSLEGRRRGGAGFCARQRGTRREGKVRRLAGNPFPTKL